MLKWIEIDLKILKNNVRAVKRVLKPGVKLMAVVKADGYGHGAEAVSRAALSSGADCLGVLTADEGSILRQALPNAEINLLAPSLPEETRAIIKNRLIPTTDSLAFIKALNRRARGAYPYHIDIDSGLGRWGVSPGKFEAFLKTAAGFSGARPVALSTHLAYAPRTNMTEAEEKLAVFKRLGLKAKTIFAGLKLHAANSALLCDLPHWQLDMARIGNLIYGIYPTDVYREKAKGTPIIGLARPWRFYSRIISIRKVKKDEDIGYSSAYAASKNMTIATIPAGYSDGLSMEPAERSIKITAGFVYWGLINGKKAFFAGKCGIAHSLLDVTNIPEAKVGTPVSLHVRRTAANARIPRIYK
ncbi:MAG: alanine racemase [Elusimicrobia bacterium GWC2_51_8]|nr:MAG: alanine racemase [Elusimicrobia bacterium GWA2_51_34]OGR66392.1 MAG: alanine racemase [Elusimicrobia bacterium GWC2_51_8]OGR86684.1 MAG: alanine racemase [Elusimicrobia bacterium GWF2_52_66]